MNDIENAMVIDSLWHDDLDQDVFDEEAYNDWWDTKIDEALGK